MFSRILIPTDGSEPSVRAAHVAAWLATQSGAEVVLLTCVSVPQSLVMAAGIGENLVEEYVENQGREALAPAEAVLLEAGVGFETKIVLGAAAEVIVEQAHLLAADMVVVGKRGLGEIRGLFMGSVSDRVAHRLHVPVVLVP